MHLAEKRETDFMTSDIMRAFAALGPYEHAPHLAVAVSGGSDSMALALLAHTFAASQGGRITALTIDHGLRSESAQEVKHVHAWLTARGIACDMLRVDVPRKGNRQANAREARYAVLTAWCQEHHVLHLCVGQHADDQAETITLHIARGDTHDGASGMAAVSFRDGVRILRPLLGTRKRDLTHYLTTLGQTWIEDPSNTSDAYARNRLRGTLDVPALCATATREGQARAAREAALAHNAAHCVTLYPEGYALLHLAAYRTLEEDAATMLLANLLRTLSGKATRPRGHEVTRLHAALLEGKPRATLAGFSVRSDGNHVLFVRELARMHATDALPPSGRMRYDDRFDMRWQHLPAQHHIAPLGMAGKKQFAGALAHLPRGVGETLPAIWHLEEVVGVPHIAQAARGFMPAFAPAKPLAASPFWWLNASINKK